MAIFYFSAEQPEQRGIGIWDRATTVSQTLKVLFAIAAAIIIANFVAGNPLVLLANATASVVGQPAPQPLTSDEIALFRKATYQTEPELSRAEVHALATRFQAWAAEADAREQVQPAKDLRTAIVTQPKSAQINHRRPQHKARSAVHHTKHAGRHKRQKQYAQALDWFAPTNWSVRHSVWFF